MKEEEGIRRLTEVSDTALNSNHITVENAQINPLLPLQKRLVHFKRVENGNNMCGS